MICLDDHSQGSVRSGLRRHVQLIPGFVDCSHNKPTILFYYFYYTVQYAVQKYSIHRQHKILTLITWTSFRNMGVGITFFCNVPFCNNVSFCNAVPFLNAVPFFNAVRLCNVYCLVTVLFFKSPFCTTYHFVTLYRFVTYHFGNKIRPAFWWLVSKWKFRSRRKKRQSCFLTFLGASSFKSSKPRSKIGVSKQADILPNLDLLKTLQKIILKLLTKSEEKTEVTHFHE